MSNKKLKLLCRLSVFMLIMVIMAVYPKPPREVAKPDSTLGTVQPDHDYRLLSVSCDTTSYVRYVFLLYEETTNTRDSLVCPVTACDTVLKMRPQTLRVVRTREHTIFGRVMIGHAVKLNPYGPDQLMPMAYFPAPPGLIPPPDSTKYITGQDMGQEAPDA